MIEKRNFIFSLLLIMALSGFAGNISAQWSFTFNLVVTGPCGGYVPYVPPFNVPNMPTQSSCESLRQTILSIKVSQPMYDSYGNPLGDCTAGYSATPCTGSDMSSSDYSNPGSVSIDALLQGNPFFSPHETRALENWFSDYQLKLSSMGVEFNQDDFLTSQEVPLTGMEEFDDYYMKEIVRFEYPEQGGVVDLTGKQGVVDINGQAASDKPAVDISTEPKTVPIMGSSPMTPDEIERMNAMNLKSIPNNDLDESNFQMEESPFWDTPEMKELGITAAKFTAGFLSGGVGYAAIVGVDVISGVLTDKSGGQIALDVVQDVGLKGFGDLGGAVVSTGAFGIGKMNVVTSGKVSLAAAKGDYDVVLQAGQSAVDSWELVTKAKK